jgi:PAS domain S-box-containing protein
MTRASPPHGDLSSLFNFLPIGAYRCSPDGVMLRANTALVELNGYASEEALLDSVRVSGNEWYVLPGRRAEFRHLLERDGYVRGFVSEIRPKGSDRHIWVSENAHVVRDADGAVLYYEGTFEDITAQVLAQQAQRSSEEQLRLLTAQIPGMVYMLDLDKEGRRRYRFVSEGVREIYGFGPQELMRDPMLIARYRHPDDAARLAQETVVVLNEGVDLAGEYRVVWPDGRLRWVYQRSCEVARSFDRVTRVGVLLDVTERVLAQQALSSNEALWKVALESAGDGVWDWNLLTGKEYFSPRILAMYGFDADELVKPAEEMDRRTHPDDVPQMLADRQAHFEGRVPVYRNEHRIRCKDGSWKWVLSRGMVIARDDDGRPVRMVGTHTDITELKQTEARRHVLEVQLRESQKMEAIGTLAGGVAHDFNNLLAAILGNLTLAREDLDAGHPAQESLTEVQRAAIRARQLVQQILTFSRRQDQPLVRQPLTPLVEEGLRLLRSLLPAGVRLHASLVDGLDVMADATQVQQVLMNLCTNAWQSFAGRGGEISVSLRRRELGATEAEVLGGLAPGPFACLSVADDGPGMDADTERRIFEPFFTTKAPGEGTGLGLAVVHGIVQAHNGAIAVRSHPGAGTRFDVWLPLQSSARPPQSPSSPPPVEQPAPACQEQGVHVVYIDDYEALVFLVGRLLRKEGYRVSTFESGEAALHWMRNHPQETVDLVLTDQNMPGMSGLDVARELRLLRPALRVVMISGHVTDALVSEAAELGVFRVMGKQDSMDALGSAIRSLIEETRAA